MKILGLDVGINSIGFSVVDFETETILCSGVHLFDKAEQPTGASLALPRRTARGQRRAVRRRADRKRLLRESFEAQGIPTDFTLPSEGFGKTPWELRAEGLERRLTPQEFGRVLYHLAKRRGFQSNRKNAGGKNDDENKKMLGAASNLQKAMEDGSYKTIGAYLSSLDKQRNGNEDYTKTVLRKLVKEEVQTLFEAQRSLENSLATIELEQAFSDVAFHQRPLRSAEDLVGNCSLETAEKRAPKFSRSAELFVLWQKINHIRLELTDGSNERPLTPEQRLAVFEKCHIDKTFKYEHLRKIVGETIDIDGNPVRYFFKGLLYRAEGKKKGGKGKKESVKSLEIENSPSVEEMIKTAEEKAFIELKGFHAIKDAFGIDKKNVLGKIPGVDIAQWDKITAILTYEQDDEKVKTLLREECQPLAREQVEKLSEINWFKGTVGHSAKAISRILPHLEQGETYDKACEAAGYNLYERKPGTHRKLPKFEPTRNPIVDRALAQCRKVTNAVLSRYEIDAIHIELARDVGKSWDDRREIQSQMEKNREYNETLRQEAEKLGIDVLTFRLWQEQGGYCMYSGQYIEPRTTLKDPTAIQIDHILPHSRTFDDSRNNLTLCLSDENQKKKNKTPWEYIGHNETAWQNLEARVQVLPWKKRRQFLIKNLSVEMENSWKERHLNDTRWIARELKNHIERHLDFSGSKIEKKQRVLVLSGRITATLRRMWGLSKSREESAKHHAQDALVIACTSQGMVQRVTEHEKYKDGHRNKEIPKPWATFREDVQTSLEGVFVSRLPNRKMTGELHKATVHSLRTDDATGKKYTVQRLPLSKLTPANLEQLVDKDRNIRLYQVLKKRLDEHEGKPDKAFKEPIYMPVRGNKTAPQIHAVRIRDDAGANSGIKIRDGLASNGDMLRVDVFEKGGKSYLCPIYTWHAYQETLPNQVIKAHTPENEWPQIEDEYFKFSLYKYDLIRLVDKSDKELMGYYIGTHRVTGQLNFIKHDLTDSKKADAKGSQNLEIFKYVVNVFGERYLVQKEKRLGLANPSRTKSRLAQPEPATTGL